MSVTIVNYQNLTINNRHQEQRFLKEQIVTSLLSSKFSYICGTIFGGSNMYILVVIYGANKKADKFSAEQS